MQIKTITNISFLIYKPVKIQMAQAHSYTVNGNTKWHFPSWEEFGKLENYTLIFPLIQ